LYEIAYSLVNLSTPIELPDSQDYAGSDSLGLDHIRDQR